jgi:symplekin
MDPTVQEAVQELLVRPIHAIGPNNFKLLGYLKDYPEGAEQLVLKILNVFVDGQRPSPNIIALVKTLIADRGADARFLMLIISEMDKVSTMIIWVLIDMTVLSRRRLYDIYPSLLVR